MATEPVPHLSLAVFSETRLLATQALGARPELHEWTGRLRQRTAAAARLPSQAISKGPNPITTEEDIVARAHTPNPGVSATAVRRGENGYPIPVLDEGVPQTAAGIEDGVADSRSIPRVSAEPVKSELGHRLEEHQLRDIKLVSDVSLGSLDLDELLPLLLDRVLDLLRSDTAAVLLHDAAANQLVARAARGLEEEVRQGVRIPVGTGFAGRIAAERRPFMLNKVDSTTVANPILWEKGIRSMLGVPLLAAGTLIGVLHVGSYTPAAFDDDDVMLLELAADKLAIAAQSGIADAERRAAGVLQRGLLPTRPLAHPQIEFASRYVPAERGDIGGDWYDAFELPSGDVWVMAGDVVGHGLQPAIIMGRLRSTLRAYALLRMSPEDVLRAANRKLQLFEPGAMATVICGVLTPPFDELRLCSAGHLPPILVHPGGDAQLLHCPLSPPLGVLPQLEPSSMLSSLEDGSTLVLYTDGLVERRGESITDGLERLRTAVHDETPESLCAAGDGRHDRELCACRRRRHARPPCSASSEALHHRDRRDHASLGTLRVIRL